MDHKHKKPNIDLKGSTNINTITPETETATRLDKKKSEKRKKKSVRERRWGKT